MAFRLRVSEQLTSEDSFNNAKTMKGRRDHMNKRFLAAGMIMMFLVSQSSCKAESGNEKAVSYTPTPEFWEEFDRKGITEKMIADSVNDNDNCAQYLMFIPRIEKTEEGFDFFSVEFCTDTQPDATYWSLANWEMDDQVYMKENGWTAHEYTGAYGGLQDVVDHNTKIMSMWETYYKGEGKEYTLLPNASGRKTAQNTLTMKETARAS